MKVKNFSMFTSLGARHDRSSVIKYLNFIRVTHVLFCLLLTSPVFSQNTKELCESAFEFLLNKNYPDAMNYADKVISKSINDSSFNRYYFLAKFVRIAVQETLDDKSMALEGYKELLHEFLSFGNKKDKDYLFFLNNKALLEKNLGLMNDAVIDFSESIELSKHIYGEYSQKYIESLERLGFLYYDIGQFERSKSYFLGAMNSAQKVFGESSRNYAVRLKNLGMVFVQLI